MTIYVEKIDMKHMQKLKIIITVFLIFTLFFTLVQAAEQSPEIKINSR